MFDLIGDIHGHATALKTLLGRMGYARASGVWRHPSRTAVFLGDFVDRGPEIRETIDVARSMVEAGAALAVMGNHEMNAIAFAVPRLDRSGEFCRRHTERNLRQHRATLEQLTDSERADALEWFRTLPLWLELDGVRVVHACWHEPSIEVLRALLAREGGVTDNAVRAMHAPGDPAFDAMEMVLKGPEIHLPKGTVLNDAEGHPRRVIRARWFEPPRAWTYDALVFPPSPLVPQAEVPLEDRRELPHYPVDAPPLFFGHYWMPSHEHPALLAPNIACLDWSVARGGRLVAYRWDGERTLDASRLLSVPSPQEPDGRTAARTMPA